jgi:phage repressor protein C with HTH and peptisase S24 domain
MRKGKNSPVFSHETIWNALDQMAMYKSLSPSALARQAGLDPTSFNPSKRQSRDGRPRWPSTESIFKVLKATGTTLDEFIAYVKNAPEGKESYKAQNKYPLSGLSEKAQTPLENQLALPDGLVRTDLPDYLNADPFFLGFSLQSEIYAPLYHTGDQLLVSLNAPLQRGCKILVATDNQPLKAFILIQESPQTITCQNPAILNDQHSFDRKKISFLGRIVWVSQ